MYPVDLRTERLHIRELKISDTPVILAIRDDELVQRFYAWNAPTTLEEYSLHLKVDDESLRSSDRSTYQLAIVQNSKVLGKCGLMIESSEYACAEITYLIDPTHRQVGIATEAISALTDFGFTELGLHRISATLHPDNIGFLRVLEKVGFSYEGRMRDHKFVNGQWRDSLLFARLVGDPERTL